MNFIFILTAIIFVVSRLMNLMQFPPFMDETIYIRWLRIIKQTGHWFLPLREFGWAPLTTWISTLLSYLVKDDLLSLRLTAGLFGGLSLIIAYKLAKLLFNDRRTTILTLLFIILSPFILIHDRLGLRGDSAVTFTALLLLYGLAKRLLKKQKTAAYLIGLAIALGLLIKSTAWIFPLMTLSAYLVFRPKLFQSDWLGGLLAGSSLLFYLLTNSLTAFLNKTNVFLVSPDKVASLSKNNFIQLAQWSYQYLSLPVLLLIFYGAYLSFKKNKKVWLLLTSAILPVLIFDTLFAKIFFPRYLLFIAAYSFFFAAFGLTSIFKKLPGYLFFPVLLLIFLPNLITDTAVIRDIKAAKLPEIERWQYVTGWPSGYGLKELSQYLQTDTPDILITEENNLVRGGLPYLWPEHSLEIIAVGEDNSLTQEQLTKLKNSPKIYLVLNVAEKLPKQLQGELIKKFPRPENKTSLRLYKTTVIK